MKLSGEKKNNLYSAIAGKIMDVRVELRTDSRLEDKEKLDARLFKLEQQIWSQVKTVLKLED